MVAMVAADEFNDAVTAGVGACQTQSAHGCFGAAVDHAYHIHGRYKAAHELS